MLTPQEVYEKLPPKYQRKIQHIAKSYFILGADENDVLQIGMIGAFKAVRDFNPNKGCSFDSFLETCVRRNIITGVKHGGRRKHQPINQAKSLDQPKVEHDHDTGSLEETLEGYEINPHNFVGIKEDYLAFLNSLSHFEYHCYILQIKGYEYEEIANSLDCRKKQVDNALRRAKLKQKEFIN